MVLLSHRADHFTIDKVAQGVADAGFFPLRIDTDAFPESRSLSVEASGPVWFDDGARAHRLDGARGVWTRRVWPGPHASASHVHRLACQAACVEQLTGALLHLRFARWVNPWSAQVAAESKLLQLREAAKVGLRVPPTLVTNDAREVKAFAKRHGPLVTKLLVPLSQSMAGDGPFFYTTRVDLKNGAGLEGLKAAPQIFQPLLEKRSELRVIAVDGKLFTGAIDTQSVPHARLDWRRATSADSAQWTRAQLPAKAAAATLKLMRVLGLVYGAFDFIVPKVGAPWFLEVNPAGEWGFLERDLGFPIAAAISTALVKEPNA